MYRPATAPSGDANPTQAKEDQKLRQVIPRFFTKAALTVISSRIDLPPAHTAEDQVKTNSWFNLILDETHVLTQPLAPWARMDPFSSPSPPLIIELYLDTAELNRNQTLVVVDERGRRWDVREALTPPSTHDARRHGHAEIVLERWKLYLDESSTRSGVAETVSNAYKKAVVLFRSLYTTARLLPAFKFSRKLAQNPTALQSLRPQFRIRSDDPTGQPRDSLTAALYPSADTPFEKHTFQPTYTTAGSLCIDVSYRSNCDFRVDDSEAILSSHFMGLDSQSRYFRPSLGDPSTQDAPYLAGGKGVGSLPADKRVFKDRQDLSQVYGSMSTFHNLDVPTGTSPISALRHVRDLRSESPTHNSPPQASSLRREIATIKARPNPSPSNLSSIRSQARYSASSNAPALLDDAVSSSPRGGFRRGSVRGPAADELETASSLGSRPSPYANQELNSLPTGGIAFHRRQSSLNAPTDHGPPSLNNEVAVGSPQSSSPRAPPITRYSSSFGHRRSRLSSDKGSGGGGVGSNNRAVDEEALSSGRASQMSHQPGSGLLLEGEQATSSSQRSDEDNISDFLKSLERSKDLRSFNRNDETAREATTRRTTIALSRYRGQRDSLSALGDSMSSSVMLHRSSSNSSKQLPPGLAGASVSTSSSPGKPLSPHTPHTPAVPSRLSAQRTAQEDEASSRSRLQSSDLPAAEAEALELARAQGGFGHLGAIDIPTSPHRFPHVVRRSSSAADAGRDSADEEYLRSVSLPMDAAQDLSLSELFAIQNPPPETSQQSRRPTAAAEDTEDDDRRSPVVGSLGRGRFARGAFASRNNRGSREGPSRASRIEGAIDDDEPLLFTMSEIEQSGRRVGGG